MKSTPIDFPFEVVTKDAKYVYTPIGDNTYQVISWIGNQVAPTRLITSEQASNEYNYCSSMWNEYDVEKI